MEWLEFVDKALMNESEGEKIRLQVNSESVAFGIPPVVQVSIKIINRILKEGEKYILMSLPDTEYLPAFIILWKLISDLLSSDLVRLYDPTKFEKGQRLKLGNAVVAFESLENIDGVERICIQLAGGVFEHIPISAAPFFQLTDTRKCLSSSKVYYREKQNFEYIFNPNDQLQEIVRRISELRTHNRNYYLVITQKNLYSRLIDQLYFESHEFKDIILAGYSNQDGEINIRETGNFTGLPSIVFASDFYEAVETAKINPGLKMIFVDPSRFKQMSDQIDKFDEIREMGIESVVFVNSQMLLSDNSEPILNREPALWEWDAGNVSDKILERSFTLIDNKLSNLKSFNTVWQLINDEKLSNCVEQLNLLKSEILESGYETLISYHEALLFSALDLLNQMYLFSDTDIKLRSGRIDIANDSMSSQRRFMDKELLNQLDGIAKHIKSQLRKSDSYFLKYNYLKEFLNKGEFDRCCVILPKRVDVEKTRMFWDRQENIYLRSTNVEFLSITEFLNNTNSLYDVTLIGGWVGREKMKEILHSNLCQKYIVYLLPIENKWMNASINYWKKMKSKYQLNTINTRFNLGSRNPPEETIPVTDSLILSDDFDQLDIYLNDRKYSKYSAKQNANESSDALTLAIPVSFAGDYFTFMTETHSVIVVTEIVFGSSTSIEQMTSAKLEVGDFIAVRDSEQDIIKELADKILFQSNKSGLRKLSSIWKDALVFETALIGFDSVFEKLKLSGCKKEKSTVRSWVYGTDRIMPSSKDDLGYIAKITGDDTLMQLLENVYDAGIEVRRAHSKAGRYLSDQLIRCLANSMTASKQYDPYNINDEIDMNIESVGQVKILKIIDIGSKIVVRNSETNRLLREN
ncbi:MAG: hypothetical protein EOM06_07615 [Sphingobacteriia bacterium]|nr:hypothetical protein [Sphingobacteriia bacterium]